MVRLQLEPCAYHVSRCLIDSVAVAVLELLIASSSEVTHRVYVKIGKNFTIPDLWVYCAIGGNYLGQVVTFWVNRFDTPLTNGDTESKIC